jgi:tRNA (mo5U34)-methyltransferase
MFDDVETPGTNSVEAMCDALSLPEDLSGKRVLDVGAWNGCLSFECERRGAHEVVALSPEDPDWSGFHRIRQAIGSTRARYVRGSIYDLNPEELGYFDVVVCCGILYHLRYPLLGIDNLRRVCTGELFVETQVCDHYVLARGRRGLKWTRLAQAARGLAETALWQFYRLGELRGDASNWFSPTRAAVLQALESAGFEAEFLRQVTDERATFRAKVKEGLPEFLAIDCGESVFYDVVARPLFSRQKLVASAPPRWTLPSRRTIADFPVTGVGPELEEILAKQPPIQERDAEPLARLKRTIKRLANKVLPRFLRRSA